MTGFLGRETVQMVNRRSQKVDYHRVHFLTIEIAIAVRYIVPMAAIGIANFSMLTTSPKE